GVQTCALPISRLHIQVNQTMQFYRGQQGGSAPARLFLSGGASIMPYTAQFFAEKLNVPVEYFNPFRNVQIDPTVNLEELVRVAHSMGEVVGLGLRNLAHCPVELNLMPESTRKWRAFNEKKPYLIATVFTIVVVVAVIGLLFSQLSSAKADKIATIEPTLQKRQSANNEFNQAQTQLTDATNEFGQLAALTTDRYYWVDALPKLRTVLTNVQAITSNKWHSAAGVWIERFATPSAPDGGAAGANAYAASTPDAGATIEQDIENKYSLGLSDQNAAAAAATPPPPGSGVTSVIMVCRAVKGPSDQANSELMYSLLDHLKQSPLVDPKGTQVGEKLITDDSPFTFTFAVKVALRNPLKF